MAIQYSVGVDGVNDEDDVRVVQAALNLSQSGGFTLLPELVVDGRIGPKTNSAIELFQKTAVGYSNPDGRVDPAGATLAGLAEGTVKGLMYDSVMAIMVKAESATIGTYLPLLRSRLPRYEIHTPRRIAHFLAQIGHESLSLKYTEELASGEAYEGRSDLGNTQAGDGRRFKGRGLIQLTGRANYAEYGQYASVNLLEAGNEDMIAKEPHYALDVALWFWDSRGLNRYADRDDVRAITRRINGGYNGLADRERYLQRAKFFLLPPVQTE